MRTAAKAQSTSRRQRWSAPKSPPSTDSVRPPLSAACGTLTLPPVIELRPHRLDLGRHSRAQPRSLASGGDVFNLQMPA